MAPAGVIPTGPATQGLPPKLVVERTVPIVQAVGWKRGGGLGIRCVFQERFQVGGAGLPIPEGLDERARFGAVDRRCRRIHRSVYLHGEKGGRSLLRAESIT